MSNPALRNFCFTLFIPIDAPPQDIFRDRSNVRYACWQLELCPTTMRNHCQGYLELNRPARLRKVAEYFAHGGAHLERRRGTRDQAREYARKEETRISGPWEFGSWGTQQGERTDLHLIDDQLKAGASLDQIDSDWPEQASRNFAWIQRRHAFHQRKRITKPDIILRPWQVDLQATLINEEPHPRKVLWYYDEKGGSGKTTFAKWMLFSHPGQVAYFRGGKHADVAFAWQYEKIVIFDFCRESKEFINYALLEHVKDGIIFSGKYQSATKVGPIPHVVVFANTPPDKEKMSADRWEVHHIITWGNEAEINDF